MMQVGGGRGNAEDAGGEGEEGRAALDGDGDYAAGLLQRVAAFFQR